MSFIINVENLEIKFSSQSILFRFSFHLAQNDFLVLLGKNGSGKSTLIKALMGLVNPSKGKINVFNLPVSSYAFKKNIYRIGYVPQVLNINYRMPFQVSEIISMGRFGKRGLIKRLTSEDKDIIAQTMKEINIAHLANRPIGHLSGGERQKVQIARALCQEPDLLLLDEPTSHLDLNSQYELIDLFQKIYEEKKISIILVLHDLYYIPATSNRAIIIHNRLKYFDGTIAKLLSLDVLQEIYQEHTRNIINKCLCRN